MRRTPAGRDTPAAEQDDSDDRPESRTDWLARHARTRTAPDGPAVRADDDVDHDDDDRHDEWLRRHGRTPRT